MIQRQMHMFMNIIATPSQSWKNLYLNGLQYSIDAIGSALRVPRNEVSQVGVIELIGPPPPRPLYSVEECLVKEQPNSPVKLSLTGGSWCPHCQGLGFDFHFVNLI